jgi:hypothetical protein
MWLEHQTGSAKPEKTPRDLTAAEVDFTRCIVIAVFEGDGFACAGFKVHSVTETAARVILRVNPLYYQTGIGIPPGGPEPSDNRFDFNSAAWGIVVLPRTEKPVVVERTTSTIGDPPL